VSTIPDTARRRVLAHVPTVVAVVACAAILVRYGTPLVSVALFAAYAVLLGVPGTLMWRLTFGRKSLLEDVAAGLAIGLAVEALAALALSPLGLADWSWLWSPLVTAAVAVAPRLRHRASGGWQERQSAPATWAVAAGSVVAVLWLAATSFGSEPIATVIAPGGAALAMPETPSFDLAFQQALAAGIDRFWPPVYPYLYDEPLHYHFFLYEIVANVRAVTGVEVAWVLYRLVPAGLLVVSVLLAAVLARRLARSTRAAGWGAVVGVLASNAWPTARAMPPSLTQSRWGDFSPGLLNFSVLRSPTQTLGVVLVFGLLLTAAAVLAPGPGRSPIGGWGVAILLGAAAAGAKVTALPVLLAGLAVAALAPWSARVMRRRALLLAALLAGCFVWALSVIYRSDAGSLHLVSPHLSNFWPVIQYLGVDSEGASRWAAITLTVLTGGAALAGVVLLPRRAFRDPRFALLAGTSVAGGAATLLLQQNGSSEIYFLYSAWPAVVALAAWGLGAARWPWRVGVLVVAGITTTVLVQRLVARRAGAGPVEWKADLVVPGVVLVAVWLGIAVAVAARSRGELRAGVAIAAVAVLAVGAAFAVRATDVVESAATLARPAAYWNESGTVVGADARNAAAIVRTASPPTAVVATNAHCAEVLPAGRCRSFHFWISALTERRVVVEGWGYPEKSSDTTPYSPFWNQDRLKLNDRVFDDADAGALQQLVADYDVQWLFVDRTVAPENPALRNIADLVVDTPDAALYRVRG